MRFKLIIISVLTLIAAYSVFWFQVASKVEEATLAWIEDSQRNITGLKVYSGDVSVSGFPYKVIVEISSLNATLSGSAYSEAPISVSTPRISAVFQPWNPNHVVVVTEYFDTVIGNMEMPDLSLNFDNVKSSIVLDPNNKSLNNLSIIADTVKWHKGLEAGTDENSILEMAELHLRKTMEGYEPQNSYDLPISRILYFKADNAKINEFKTSFLGDQSNEIKVDAVLHANQQPEFTKKSLAQWRDEGGTLSIRSFEYGTNTTNVKLSGDVTLDENFKPLGAFDANIFGIENIFSALSENENVSDMGRQFLKSQAQNNTMPENVPLSLSMQNGFMYLGPIVLMELDPVIN